MSALLGYNSGLQTSFDDLYSATYAILDDAKTDHELVKLYKGSHASPDPHPVVTDFGEYFYRTRRGLLAYACDRANPGRPPTVAELDAFDAEQQPRIPLRAVFKLLFPMVRRQHETVQDVLDYLTSRTHRLGAYRGGSSGYEEETLAFAAAHFRSLGLPATPRQVQVFCGGAKGAFMAFCAAIMCHRDHDDVHRAGGLLLTPVGYYQSLRLIPPIFGGDIHVTTQLTGQTVRDWLNDTTGQRRRCLYVPLVNNTDGRVLTRERACSIAAAVLEHNGTHPERPVYVLADDVYAGSYLSPVTIGVPIGAITGTDVGDPELGRMSDWTLSVATASKTFALPTARVAFATTTNQTLARAIAHYRTVLSQGRVPQAAELTAAAAVCWTPQSWIDHWNRQYRTSLSDLQARLWRINNEIGIDAFTIHAPEGGWYVPLRISPRLLASATSSLDAFAVLLHYSRTEHYSGIAMLPGELFGHRDYRNGFLLRGTLAAGEQILHRFTSRLRDAARLLTSPDRDAITKAAKERARQIADVDAILTHCRY